MGLNPPFGVNAALANKFINKALEFKPKLLILIVPRETQRYYLFELLIIFKIENKRLMHIKDIGEGSVFICFLLIRLDEKESPYDLILEDDQMFVGKVSWCSFSMVPLYFPLAISLSIVVCECSSMCCVHFSHFIYLDLLM